MGTPNRAATLRWILDKEANGGIDDPNLSGAAVLAAAKDDGLIGPGDEDGFGMLMLKLHNDGLVKLDSHLLTTDQGPQIFASRPSFELQQVMGMTVTSEGTQWIGGIDAATTSTGESRDEESDVPLGVMVVHGRNELARQAVFEFLEKLGLRPLSWNDLVRATGKASPYIGEVLDVAFEIAGASVVIFTPDDEARLRPELQDESDPPHEKDLTPQARPNVIFEAGMAMAALRDKTIFLKLGTLREFSDTHGRHDVRVGDAGKALADVAERLETIFGELDRSDGWDDPEKLDDAMKLATDVDVEAETEQDAEAIQDLNDDMRRWLADRDRELSAEMTTLSQNHASAGTFYSGGHGVALARAKSRALHQYRDEITRKRRTWRELARGNPDPPRFELDENSKAILAAWRADAVYAGSSDGFPVDDVTAQPGEESIRVFEEQGDPPSERIRSAELRSKNG